MIESREPDLVFLDVQMPGLSGLGVIEKLKEKNPSYANTGEFQYDGEKIVAAFSLDPRRIGKKIGKPDADVEPDTVAFAATDDGYALRFSFANFAAASFLSSP